MTAKIIVTERFGDGANVHFEDKVQCVSSTVGGLSDGYHTFDELYDHRSLLFLNMMTYEFDRAWFSDKHHNGSRYEGYFIAGIKTNKGDISYHLPNKYIELAHKTGATHLTRAPEWDGHSSQDVLTRLKGCIE